MSEQGRGSRRLHLYEHPQFEKASLSLLSKGSFYKSHQCILDSCIFRHTTAHHRLRFPSSHISSFLRRQFAASRVQVDKVRLSHYGQAPLFSSLPKLLFPYPDEQSILLMMLQRVECRYLDFCSLFRTSNSDYFHLYTLILSFH